MTLDQQGRCMRTWSFSSLSLYESCPQKYKLKYLDGIKEAEHPAAQRGTAIHTQLETYLTNRDSEVLPEEANPFREYYNSLRNEVPAVEAEWWFDHNWTPVSPHSSKRSCVMKLDAICYLTDKTILIVDHKTGKPSPVKHLSQGQLYAVGAMNQSPMFEKYQVDFVYLDQNAVKSNTYNKTQLLKFQENFDKRADKLLNDEAFTPISNKFNCKYCSVKEHCQYRSDE